MNTMDPKLATRLSKFLALHLRHTPEALGLTLAPGGWVDVEALLEVSGRRGLPLTRAELEAVVAGNDKQRFSFDASGMRLRANQGHSTPVDLQLTPLEPPPLLYHGTAATSLEAIRRTGLVPMARHHVHLSLDTETARRVGARHGRPVVLEVAAGAMSAVGHVFYRSENGVWLTDRVPPEHLRHLER